jgi:hypothetical protein
MRFTIEKWKIEDLIAKHKSKELNLNPPYQRNDIWTEKAQKDLINSIQNGFPIPNFFFHQRGKKLFDVADGQQRTRAIIAFIEKEISDINKKYFDNEKSILNYEIPVVIINQDVTDDEIRKFYVKVNNTGLRLNNPELTKSTYFDSDILKLVEGLTESDDFKQLGIFTEKQENRMIDREFVEELIVQLYYGIGDKKNAIKTLYNDNISEDKISIIKSSFEKIIKICIDSNFDFNNSRYSQRNDFYTLFGFINNNPQLKQETFNYFFSLLFEMQDDISPSNEDCEPFQYYAYRCVSQTNSKTARLDRLEFLNSLFLNKSENPSKIQKQIMKYYGFKISDLIKIDGFLLLDSSKIVNKFKEE